MGWVDYFEFINGQGAREDKFKPYDPEEGTTMKGLKL